MLSQDRQDKVYAFVSNKCQFGADGVTWKEIFEHCQAMEVTTNPNTLNYDLSSLRVRGYLTLGDDDRWRA